METKPNLLEQWKKHDPLLSDLDGFQRFSDAHDLKRLIRLGHPDHHGEPWSRWQVMDAIREWGMKILEDLGWPTDLNSHYENLHTWTVSRLGRVLHQFWNPEDRPTEPLEAHLFSVLEHWEPTDKTETVYPALTDEDEVYAIQCALEHVADDYIPRTAKEFYEKFGRKEALKFLRQQLNNFGCGGGRKPSVRGTPKGVVVAYNKDFEQRLIRHTRILNHVLEEG